MTNPLNNNYQQVPATDSQSQPKPSFFKCFSCFFRIFTLFFSKKDNQPTPSLATKNISTASKEVASIPRETVNRGIQGNSVNESTSDPSEEAVPPHNLTETPTDTTSNNDLDKSKEAKKTVSFVEKVSCKLIPLENEEMSEEEALITPQIEVFLNSQGRVWGKRSDVREGDRHPLDPYRLDFQIEKKHSREQIDKSLAALNSITALAKELNQKASPSIKRLFPNFPVFLSNLCRAGISSDGWKEVACKKIDRLILYLNKIQSHTIDKLGVDKKITTISMLSFKKEKFHKLVFNAFPPRENLLQRDLHFLSERFVDWKIAHLKGDKQSFVEKVRSELEGLKDEINNLFNFSDELKQDLEKVNDCAEAFSRKEKPAIEAGSNLEGEGNSSGET